MTGALDPRDGVVLLHGIGRGARSMRRADRALQEAGFRTLSLDYPGRKLGLDALADEVFRMAAGWMDGVVGQVHFVAHSMGGLVARALITRHRPARLGRLVMLGPPNNGSEIADLLAGTRAYRTVFGPAGLQLTTRPGAALAALLGPVDFPVGVIAGTRTLDPLAWLLLPKPNDGRVSVASTRVVGMSDHLVLPATHALMMLDPAVLRATVAFLRDGRFGAGAT